MAAKRQSLGKGLDALLGIPEDAEDAAGRRLLLTPLRNCSPTLIADAVVASRWQPTKLTGGISCIPGQYQPRRDLNSEALKELADSIAAQGVMQPIIVRPYR